MPPKGQSPFCPRALAFAAPFARNVLLDLHKAASLFQLSSVAVSWDRVLLIKVAPDHTSAALSISTLRSLVCGPRLGLPSLPKGMYLCLVHRHCHASPSAELEFGNLLINDYLTLLWGSSQLSRVRISNQSLPIQLATVNEMKVLSILLSALRYVWEMCGKAYIIQILKGIQTTKCQLPLD